ncbi:hypothetical protein KGQ19_00750 [Catenulispora sp. NL8]|uniref:Lipoprotein n=1 Tax=Catenulispora pinistramenti TaxID=2705254 RepID=A0ABS5KGI2_9ACTN|nr:hypothetical protein [Catenulispora pinistramenti]MBS2545388.1 hypothetical protein [Catenulispora pinistramenti]
MAAGLLSVGLLAGCGSAKSHGGEPSVPVAPVATGSALDSTLGPINLTGTGNDSNWGDQASDQVTVKNYLLSATVRLQAPRSSGDHQAGFEISDPTTQIQLGTPRPDEFRIAVTTDGAVDLSLITYTDSNYPTVSDIMRSNITAFKPDTDCHLQAEVDMRGSSAHFTIWVNGEKLIDTATSHAPFGASKILLALDSGDLSPMPGGAAVMTDYSVAPITS